MSSASRRIFILFLSKTNRAFTKTNIFHWYVIKKLKNHSQVFERLNLSLRIQNYILNT